MVSLGSSASGALQKTSCRLLQSRRMAVSHWPVPLKLTKDCWHGTESSTSILGCVWACGCRQDKTGLVVPC